MSQGEHSSPARWGDIRLSPTSFAAVLAAETRAVEDAEGDVKGAQQRLWETIVAGQREVQAREGVVVERQQAVVDLLAGMQLVGRTVEISAGTSLETDDSQERNLAGVRGELVDFEVGSVHGKPVQPAAAVILHIAIDDTQIVPRGLYPLRADQADYSLSELPHPED